MFSTIVPAVAVAPVLGGYVIVPTEAVGLATTAGSSMLLFSVGLGVVAMPEEVVVGTCGGIGMAGVVGDGISTLGAGDLGS